MENKLPPEFKEKWVAALRSGEYQQGKDALLKYDKYCCLGVACMVAGNHPVDIGGWGTPQKKHGVPGVLLDFNSNRPAYILSVMNDTGKSFSEIADYIETNL